MRTVRSLSLAAAAVALLLGCGSTIKATFDGFSDSSTDGTGDTSGDTGSDTPGDAPVDARPDGTGEGECEDGLDNDGDDLIDMDDWDCEHIYDSVEGPESDDCTMDTHCADGWEECNDETGECYDPPQGELCDECGDSADCGDGVMGESPDRDFCVNYGYNWNCSKDCDGGWDCPRGFRCDLGDDGLPPGFCRPYTISCNAMDLIGEGCTGEYDCLGAMPCHGGICTYECETNRECPDTTTCTGGWCIPD
ncbi:MAG: hypothetical protein JRG91_02055 [Deltaproteobacteria bacterium]|nr:hypothetical protein [Deltaproteobacteria bacterium]